MIRLPPRFHPWATVVAVSLCMALQAPAVHAQGVATRGILTLGGDAEDVLRRAQLLGRDDAGGFLLRSPSVLMAATSPEGDGPSALTVLLPDIQVVWNSGLPFSMNDGALWAGRGLNAMVTAGVRLRAGPLTVTLAPHALREENRDFSRIPYPTDAAAPRSEFAHPFHPMPESLDAPLRFGPEAVTRVGPGQSSVRLDLGPVDVSAGTENWWWGPGIKNAILLSNQAEGFPHVSAGTTQGLETALGSVDVRWMLGRLSESAYFDEDPTNDHRALSAVALTLRPAFDRGLTLGVARLVVAPLEDGNNVAGAALDALKNVGRPNSGLPDSTWAPGPDQIFALFGRWIFPGKGFEVYGEWARFEQPASVRDFLEFPQHAQGYTYGAQWVDPREGTARTRVQLELTNLEPAATWRHRRVTGSYTSSAVPQGFTHDGQLLGAAIGPGASGQWIAVDRLSDDGWHVGLFAGRARLDAAAQYTDVVPEPKREDVLLYGGVRGGFQMGGWSVRGEITPGVRLNYLFQTGEPDAVTGRAEGVDVGSTSLTLRMGRALGR